MSIKTKFFCKIVLVFIIATVWLSGCDKGTEQQLTEQMELGQKYLEEMDYENAIVAFQKAIEIDPKAMEAYEWLADAYIALGQKEEALDILAEGLDTYESLSSEEKTEAREAAYGRMVDKAVGLVLEMAGDLRSEGNYKEALELLETWYERTNAESLKELLDEIREEMDQEAQTEANIPESEETAEESESQEGTVAVEIEISEADEAETIEPETVPVETTVAPETLSPETTVPETAPSEVAVPETQLSPTELEETTTAETETPAQLSIKDISWVNNYFNMTSENELAGWNCIRIGDQSPTSYGALLINSSYSQDGTIETDEFGWSTFQNSSLTVNVYEYIPSEIYVDEHPREWMVTSIEMPLSSLINNIGPKTTYDELKVILENAGAQIDTESVYITMDIEPYIFITYNEYQITWGPYGGEDPKFETQVPVFYNGVEPIVMVSRPSW